MTELSATAAVEAMRKGDIKAEEYARAFGQGTGTRKP